MLINIGYSNWNMVDIVEVNKLVLLDFFIDIVCFILVSGVDGDDGEEWLLLWEQDEEGIIVMCFYQSGFKVVKVRWIGELWDIKWDVEWLFILMGDFG